MLARGLLLSACACALAGGSFSDQTKAIWGGGGAHAAPQHVLLRPMTLARPTAITTPLSTADPPRTLIGTLMRRRCGVRRIDDVCV